MFCHRSGFNIIEVILASTIIGMIIVATTTMIPKTTAQLRTDQDIATNEQVARNVMEYVRSVGFNGFRDICIADGSIYMDGDPSTINCSLAAKVGGRRGSVDFS